MADLRRIIGYVLLLACGLSLGAFTMSIGMSSAFRGENPQVALAWAPWDARAKANLAAIQVEQPEASLAISAKRLAKESLARDLTYAPSIRALGFASALSGDSGAARLLFKASMATVRRDLPTQLWLIQDRVEANDVAGALDHYDTALTTSPLAAPLLLPILAKASAEPGMARPLAELLAKQRAWSRSLIALLVTKPPSPSALVEIIEHLQQLGKPVDKDALSSALATLVRGGNMNLAWIAYRLARQMPELDSSQIRDGGFEAADNYPPGDWLQNDSTDRRIHREIRANRNVSLFFMGSRSIGARIVSQMLQLRPGHYRLTGLAGDIPSVDPPYWELVCAGKVSASLGKFAIDTRGDMAHFSGTFEVPLGACPNQMLILEAPPAAYDREDFAWIDDISIVRLS